MGIIGHYDCGAVRAATARQDLGTLENWLRMIRDVYRLHKEYLDLIYVSFLLLLLKLFVTRQTRMLKGDTPPWSS